MRKTVSRCYTLLLLLLCARSALPAEDEKPLLELGAGIGILGNAHYPGSDQSYHQLLPAPYVIYRGERFQAGRSGLTVLLADNPKWELSISANGGLPVDSDDNRAREGMHDLGWLGELGPVLRYLPFETEGGTRLRLELPIRAAISLDDAKLKHRGWTATPGVLLERQYRDWKVTGSLVAMFGDRNFNGYFYDVDMPYVTDERPHFQAEGGYLATRLGLTATRKTGRWFFGGFVHAYTLQGATNRSSPLMRQDENFAAGFMVAWVFYSSAAKVKSGRDD
jgi:outer membrane scaffolding protein for murein synthesis (MipA/OmpV family)